MAIPRIEVAPDYSVPRQIVGLWQLSAGHQRRTVSDDEALGALEAYFEAGFETFDCADIYTGVEQLLGKLRARLGARGERLRVHTKYVPDRGALASLSREQVERGIDRSLRRLRVERLDLVQFAWWDYSIPGYVEALGWLGELQQAGKIRHVGTTNFDVARLRELSAAGVSLPIHQVQYSLLDRRPQHRLAEHAAREDSWMVCYGGLAGGFLTDAWVGRAEAGDWDNRSLTKYRLIIDEAGGWDAYQELLVVLAEIGADHGVSAAQVASAWVLTQPRVAAIVVGMRDARHLQSAQAVFALSLTTDAQDRISHLLEMRPCPQGDIFGLERNPEGPHSGIMWTDLNSRAQPAERG